MGLLNTDKLPENIDLETAYKKIFDWYKKNKSIIVDRKDDWAKKSRALIDNLPNPETATEIEIRAIIREIICGLLEWAYHESDGEYKMAAYAHEAVKPFGGYRLSEEDKQKLKENKIRPFLSLS